MSKLSKKTAKLIADHINEIEVQHIMLANAGTDWRLSERCRYRIAAATVSLSEMGIILPCLENYKKLLTEERMQDRI